MATTASPVPDLGLARVLRAAHQLRIGYDDLAEIIGVDQSTLYRWRHADVTPRKSMRIPQIGRAHV